DINYPFETGKLYSFVLETAPVNNVANRYTLRNYSHIYVSTFTEQKLLSLTQMNCWSVQITTTAARWVLTAASSPSCQRILSIGPEYKKDYPPSLPQLTLCNGGLPALSAYHDLRAAGRRLSRIDTLKARASSQKRSHSGKKNGHFLQSRDTKRGLARFISFQTNPLHFWPAD
ncbi:MAG TPA: hypothetical protein VGM89_08440, partial [Puia sp.]